MRKRIVLFAVAFVLSVYCCLNAIAAGEVVSDDAGLLSASDEADLRARSQEILEEYRFQVVFLFVRSTQGKHIRDFAADYYDYGGYGYGAGHDGMIFCVDMGSRSYYTVTTGTGEEIFTIPVLEAIEEDMIDELSEGEYYLAFTRYLDDVEIILRRAANGESFTYAESVTLRTPVERTLAALPVIVILSAVIALIVLAFMRAGMKTARRRAAANSYIKGTPVISRRSDVYLYTTETRTRIQTDSGSSGSRGSGHFTGSSGTSHGGHGGHF